MTDNILDDPAPDAAPAAEPPAVTVLEAAAAEIGAPMPPEIALAVLQVMRRAHVIDKTGKNEFHNYKYATAADLLFLVQPAMAEAGLLITQHVAGITTDDGGNQIVEFRFVLYHESGVSWVYPGIWLGVAADRTKAGLGDKWFSKALTAAEKYFLLKLFKVSAIEDAETRLNDGDVDAEPDASRAAGPGPRPQPAAVRTAAPPVPADPATAAARADAQALRNEIEGDRFPGAALWLEKRKDRLDAIRAVSGAAYEALVERANRREPAPAATKEGALA
jgi:hypothetical protein